MQLGVGRVVIGLVLLAFALVAMPGSLDVQAQTGPIELNGLCVSNHTGAVSVPSPITSTNCPANASVLLIPDDFPFTLSVRRGARAVYYRTPPPTQGFTQIVFPEAGIVDFCASRSSGSLSVQRSGACPSNSRVVTVVGAIPPVAENDGPYFVTVGNNLNQSAPGLLANDDLGLPPAELVSFGVNDATTALAGVTMLDGLAGGDLTVAADGSFTLTGADTTGTFTFMYRLENLGGVDDATVTVVVQQAPVAVDDSYTTGVGVTLSRSSTDAGNLLGNDTLGYPEAAITHFGLTSPPTTVANGVNQLPLAGGQLTVDSSGGFTLTNPSQAGGFTFVYRLANAAGFDDATVTIGVDDPPRVLSTAPTDNATSVGAADNLTITFSEPVTVTGDWFTMVCGATTFNVTGNGGATTVGVTNVNEVYTLDPSTNLPGDVTCDATVVAANVSDADTNDPPDNMAADYNFSFSISPVAADDSYDSIGNVGINVDEANGLILGTGADQGSNLVVDQVQGSGTNVGAATATSQGGSVNVAANGSFTYDPPAGYTGNDTFTYRVSGTSGTSNTATVTVTIAEMIWFINQDATGSSDSGTLANPFTGIGSFNGSALPATGHTIVIYSSNTDYTVGIDLQDDQVLIGEAAGDTVANISGITVPAFSRDLPATGGTAPILTDTSSGANAIDLATNNTVRGLNIGSTNGTGILGSEVGTLVVNEVNISGSGETVDLRSTTGSSINVTLGTLTASSSSTEGLLLTGVAGSFTVTGAVDFDNLMSDGVQITNSPATINFQATVQVDTAAGDGIDLSGANGAVTFASIDLDDTVGVGLGIRNNTNAVTVSGGSIGSANDPADNAIDVNGGSGNITVAATAAKTTSGEVVQVQNRSGGTVSISGALNCVTSCTGVNVSTNSGGLTQISGGGTINTGEFVAVNLTSNTGHTIALSGGWDIDTTTATGLNATGGGTVSVTGTTNTLDSTTGAALNVVGTPIGASGMTFQRVSSNGAVSGIILNETGSAGGLTVTGITGADNSGGVIQNSTGDAVVLTNTASVSLTEMRIASSTDNHVQISSVNGLTFNSVTFNSSGNDGIAGVGVTNLALQNSTISNNGNAANEHGVNLTNVLGNSSVTGTTFSDSRTTQMIIQNNAALNAPDIITFSGNTFTDNGTPSPDFGDNLSIESGGSGNLRVVMNTSTGNNVFTGGQDGVMAATATGGALDVQITQATVTDHTGTGVNLGGHNASTLTFSISGVTTSSTNGPIGINATSIGGASLSGTISDNTVTGFFSGIATRVEGNGSGVVRIHNNTVTQSQEHGIRLHARAGTGTLHATVTNNTVDLSAGPFPLDGIEVVSGASGGGDSNLVCLNMAMNNSVSGGGEQGYRLQQRTGTTFQLQDFTGNGTVVADITTWVNTVKNNTGTTQVLIGSSFSVGTCTTP